MSRSKAFETAAGGILLAGVMLGSCFELFNVAWGTGNRLGQFSLTWAVLFAGFCAFCILILGLLGYGFRNETFHVPVTDRLIAIREYAFALRVILLIGILILPVWFFQFSMWGIVFQGIYLRLFIWIMVVAIASIFITRGPALVHWNGFLITLVLSASLFSIFAGLKYVTNYPFSLGWSEGNRLWDYSIMFGRDRYLYPADKNIFVLLEPGRQFVGSLPFLFSGLGIGMERAWVGLLGIFPYILLGLVSFRFLYQGRKDLWLLLGLWTFLFLGQGPIHPPLLLGAAMVSLAWGSSLWIAVPLMVVCGYFISISRFTWIFAPASWILLLELTKLKADIALLQQPAIKRAVLLVFSSFVGSMLLPLFIALPSSSINNSSGNATPSVLMITEGLKENLTRQSLLWYRLLPNETYRQGVLIGMLLAVIPLACLLYYLIAKKKLIKDRLQLSWIVLSSLAFLGIGMIISAKIGGGGDLHNIDMFLITLFFTFVIIILNGGDGWLQTSHAEPKWVKLLMVLSIVIPTLGPLQSMRGYDFREKTSTLVTLTGISNERTLEIYSSQDDIDHALGTIQNEVDLALKKGDVLFLDQRQLLTFDYIHNVPLIPEYEKKVLMEQALASDRLYFDNFYRDLKDNRFTLIVSQSLVTSKKGDTFQFGEENDAWLKWVSKPILCYYEIKESLSDLSIQLLVPREDTPTCEDKLP